MADEPAQRLARDFPAGHVLFREADAGHEMFVVKRGQVRITKQAGATEVALGVVGPGDFFGEMSILNNQARSATATVSEAATLLVIDPRTFEGMVRNDGEIAVRIIKKLAARLGEADAQVAALLPVSPRARVAHLLARQGAGAAPLTVEALARRIGVEPPTARAAAGRLAAAGLLALDEAGVRVADAARLGRYLDYLRLEESFGEL